MSKLGFSIRQRIFKYFSFWDSPYSLSRLSRKSFEIDAETLPSHYFSKTAIFNSNLLKITEVYQELPGKLPFY